MTRFEFVRARLAGPTPGLAWALPLTAAALIAPTMIREAIDPFVSEVPFATYFPAILLAAMFLGARYGVVVTLVGGMMANYLFMAPRYILFANVHDTIGAVLFILSGVLVVFLGATIRRTVRELEQVRRREAELNRELQHRVKNTLTVVQGLAMQTFRGNPGSDAALRTFNGRLHALGQAHEVLSGAHWDVCELPELAERALAPFNEQGAIHIDGPCCTLPELSCLPLVLALHELGTNAVKYGALSSLDGVVELSWRLRATTEETGEELVLGWRERNGPPVVQPTRRGLGTRLLSAQRGIKETSLDFRPEGLACELVLSGARPLPNPGR